MILDEKLEFCDATSVASTVGTANVGDQIDLDDTPRRLAQKTLYLVISVSTAFTSGTSSTVQFRLASDSTSTIATNGDETVHWASDVFPHTALTAGKSIIVPLPSGSLAPYERYLGLQVVTGGATTTAGAINAFLTNDVDEWEALPDAVN